MKFRKLHRLPFFLGLGGILFITACDTPARHKLLTVFFDGVPPLNPATNAAPAVVSAAATSQTAVAPPPKPTPPPENTFSVHPPFQERQCAECHESSSGMGLITQPPQLCWSCHKDFLAGQKVKHQPVENGECGDCHDPHQSENKNLLLQKGNDLCLSCHDDPLAEGKFKHQAVESGDCLDCHAPHATNFKGLLKESVKDTCAECHDDVPAKNKKDIHQPVDAGIVLGMP